MKRKILCVVMQDIIQESKLNVECTCCECTAGVDHNIYLPVEVEVEVIDML